MLDGVETLAVTAGASAPEHLVQELIAYLQDHGYSNVEEAEIKDEDVRFTLPADLESFVPRLHPVRS
jgi:4-hydroxy-3-methylbut-2-enyl diphosphate reductase